MNDEPCTAKWSGGTPARTERVRGPLRRAVCRQQIGCAAAREPWDLAAIGARSISEVTMVAILALQRAGLAARDISDLA